MHVVCLSFLSTPLVPFMGLRRLRDLVTKITLLDYSLLCHDKIFPFSRKRDTSIQALSSFRTSQSLRLRHQKVGMPWIRELALRTGGGKRGCLQ